jgi:hypothetical protein
VPYHKTVPYHSAGQCRTTTSGCDSAIAVGVVAFLARPWDVAELVKGVAARVKPRVREVPDHDSECKWERGLSGDGS